MYIIFIQNFLLNEAVPRNWVFHEGLITDQNPRDIALMTVRENLLEYLPNEIPYKINLVILFVNYIKIVCR